MAKKKAARKWGRYVNNGILNAISRPQHPSSCSLSSLVAVINYLYAEEIGEQTLEAVCDILGVNPEAEREPGNDQIGEWFATYLDRVNERRKARNQPEIGGQWGKAYHRSNTKKLSKEANDVIFSEIKKIIESQTGIFIFHYYGHYCLVAGYFEAAVEPSEAFAPECLLERWIILGDQYQPHQPVRSWRWGRVKQEFADYGICCFLKFTKT